MPPQGPDPVGSAVAPDEDGLYEDVNGDGHQGLADAVDLFRSRERLDPGYYDFTDSGRMDVADAAALFRENT